MATQIEQHPLYDTLPVGQEVIFTVSNSAIVPTETRVKFVAEVHISDTAINLSTSTPVGTFKTTPNNAGVGIFDFRPIIESFVSADNIAGDGSPYKIHTSSAAQQFPLHIINKFSTNTNSVRYLAIVFKTEYLDTTVTPNTITDDGTQDNSDEYTLFNGYLKHNDRLKIGYPNNFGYNVEKFELAPVSLAQFLSNAPTTQYANKEDYGTLSLLTNSSALSYVKFTFTEHDGTVTTLDVDNTDANGGFTAYSSDAKNQILFIGCFPANLRNYDTAFEALITAGTLSHYTVAAYNVSDVIISETVTINLNCPTLKGYEPIRLCWLNQWGAWDYYTFKMKSTKMISTKGSTYQQLGGSWNESLYTPYGYKGGKKAFRVNATEKITMNTDFVNESESEWFEELINSPEVYLVNNYISESSIAQLQILSPSLYINPVRLTTSSYTKKTVANDKLMQYTFEVEKSKNLRTQSI